MSETVNIIATSIKSTPFKLEIEVTFPIVRTVTKHFNSLKVLRQWQKRNDIDGNMYVLEYREYLFNGSTGQWERFAIFGTTVVPLSELRTIISRIDNSEAHKLE